MKLWIILISMFVATTTQAEVYKYINKQGKTAYSDTSVSGAEKIIVPPVMTYKAPVVLKAPQVKRSSLVSEDSGARVPYQHIDITSPAEQSTIRNNLGSVTVSYSLVPSLQKGDRLVLFLDGEEQQGLTVQGMVRGAHVLQLQVQTSAGAVEIISQDVTFYHHHQSRL